MKNDCRLTDTTKEAGKQPSYVIPGGSLVLANTWDAAHDPSVFADVDNFNPAANFLNHDQSEVINRNQLMLFGIGLCGTG